MLATLALATLMPTVWTLVERPPLTQWPPTLTGTLVEVKGFNADYAEAIAMLRLSDGRLRGIPYRALDADGKARVDTWLAQNPPPTPRDENYAFVHGPYDPAKDKASVNFRATPHFVLQWGNEPASDIAALFKHDRFIERNAAYLERVREFFRRDGATMPGSQYNPPRKLHVFITGTGLRDHREGFAFGGWDIVMHPAAMAPGSTVVPHEFGHCVQLASGGFRNNDLVGWFWESHANWMSQRFLPHYPAVLDGYTERGHYELTSSRFNYGSWPFLEILAEDPKLGPKFNYDIWKENRKNAQDQSIEDPLQTIVRLAQERGAFPRGWIDFGDRIGNMAARLAGMDHPQQFAWERTVRGMEQRSPGIWRSRTGVDPVPGRKGWLAPWFSQAPRQFGFNLIDLTPNPGTRRVEAEVRPMTSQKGADWRITLVAIDREGRSRYSPTVRRGRLGLDVRPDDARVVLAIAATPTEYTPDPFRPGYGRKPRYPYHVRFTGATPLPLRPRTPLPKVAGKPHPNGGGFVADTATVDPTAYVGPQATVLGNARIRGNARIEGNASVRQSATVQGEAALSDQAVVTENATVEGRARIGGGAVVTQRATVRGDASVQEAVHVLGDGVVEGNALVKGWGEVHTSPKAPLSGDLLAGEDLEVHLSSSPREGFRTGLFYGFLAGDLFARDLKDIGGQIASWDFAAPGIQVADTVGDHQGWTASTTRTTVDGRRALRGPVMLDGVALDSREWTIELALRWDGRKPGTLLKADRFAVRVLSDGSLVTSRGANLGTLPAGRWTTLRLAVSPTSVQTRVDRKTTSVPSSDWNRNSLNLRWLELAPSFPGVLESGKLWRRIVNP